MGFSASTTETESKETIDEFCDAMIQIAQEAKNDPEKLIIAPQNVFRKRARCNIDPAHDGATKNVSHDIGVLGKNEVGCF